MSEKVQPGTDVYLRNKVDMIAEKVACHEVRLDSNDKAIDKLFKKMDQIIDQIGELVIFATTNKHTAKWIVLGMSIMTLEITITCAFVGWKVWFK